MAISYGGISGDVADPIREDLITIYQGGEHFIDRMAALEAAKKRAEEALAALKLGNDIQAARADAQAKTEEADKLNAEAKAVLKDAKAKAAKIVDDGKVKADFITDGANKKRDQTLADADAARAAAEAHASKLLADAEAAHQEATKALQAAQSQAAEMQDRVNAANAAKASAEKAYAEHAAAKALYEQKMAQIKAVMG